MNNTNNNIEQDSISERQDVTCSEGEAVTELSPSSGSPKDSHIPPESSDSNKDNWKRHYPSIFDPNHPNYRNSQQMAEYALKSSKQRLSEARFEGEEY